MAVRSSAIAAADHHRRITAAATAAAAVLSDPVAAAVAMRPVSAAKLPESDIDAALQAALQNAGHARARALHAEDEALRCRSAVRSLRCPIRIMARIRPGLPGEDEDATPDVDALTGAEEGGEALRVKNPHQIEVLALSVAPKAAALAADGSPRLNARTRRRTTGGLGERLFTSGSAEGRGAPPEPKTFSFDKVFSASAGDNEVCETFNDEVAAVADGDGICIMAYGASGAGKTHTVAALAERAARALERRAVEAFSEEGLQLEVAVQMAEVHNDQSRDLLARVSAPGAAEPPDGADPPGELRAIDVGSGPGIAEGLMRTLAAGRAQAAEGDAEEAALRAQRRRSHVVMLLSVTRRNAAGKVQAVGRLCLADLAGSDRVRKGEATSLDETKEAQHVARSLGVLSDVLVARSKRCVHVPFRNSRLTHLLQDCFCTFDRFRAVIVVALAPCQAALPETVRSLQFGSRLLALAGRPSPAVAASGAGGAGGATSRRASLFGEAPIDEEDDEDLDEDSEPKADARKRALQNDAEEVSLLKAEVEQLRVAAEAARTEMNDYEKQLERRDLLLLHLQQRSDELEDTEKRRTMMAGGLAEFHRRLQLVEDVALRTKTEEAPTKPPQAAARRAADEQPKPPSTVRRGGSPKPQAAPGASRQPAPSPAPSSGVAASARGRQQRMAMSQSAGHGFDHTSSAGSSTTASRGTGHGPSLAAAATAAAAAVSAVGGGDAKAKEARSTRRAAQHPSSSSPSLQAGPASQGAQRVPLVAAAAGDAKASGPCAAVRDSSSPYLRRFRGLGLGAAPPARSRRQRGSPPPRGGSPPPRGGSPPPRGGLAAGALSASAASVCSDTARAQARAGRGADSRSAATARAAEAPTTIWTPASSRAALAAAAAAAAEAAAAAKSAAAAPGTPLRNVAASPGRRLRSPAQRKPGRSKAISAAAAVPTPLRASAERRAHASPASPLSAARTAGRMRGAGSVEAARPAATPASAAAAAREARRHGAAAAAPPRNGAGQRAASPSRSRSSSASSSASSGSRSSQEGRLGTRPGKAPGEVAAARHAAERPALRLDLSSVADAKLDPCVIWSASRSQHPQQSARTPGTPRGRAPVAWWHMERGLQPGGQADGEATARSRGSAQAVVVRPPAAATTGEAAAQEAAPLRAPKDGDGAEAPRRAGGGADEGVVVEPLAAPRGPPPSAAERGMIARLAEGRPPSAPPWPAPAPAPRTLSAGGRAFHRGRSPVSYTVEILTPTEARALSSRPPQARAAAAEPAAAWCRAQDEAVEMPSSPMSPPLLLVPHCAGSDSSDCGEESPQAAVGGGGGDSDVSASSDEEQICARLKSTLRLRSPRRRPDPVELVDLDAAGYEPSYGSAAAAPPPHRSGTAAPSCSPSYSPLELGSAGQRGDRDISAWPSPLLLDDGEAVPCKGNGSVAGATGAAVFCDFPLSADMTLRTPVRDRYCALPPDSPRSALRARGGMVQASFSSCSSY